ncbi:MAG: hypothetical protein ACTHLD_04300 [Chitinophaga sp.]
MIPFFNKITDVLSEQKIPYMLSGSVAMSLYILPRATRDFDFIVHLEPKNIDRFVDNFKDGYYCDKDAVNEAVKRQGMFNIIDHESGFKADFVVLKSEPFRQTEFERKVEMNFYGRTIYVVSPEDLLISKLIWIQDLQSPIQMEDIRNIAEKEDLDREYIKSWVKRLNLNTFDLLDI